MEDRGGKLMRKSAKNSYFAGARTTCFITRNQISVPVLYAMMSGEFAFRNELFLFILPEPYLAHQFCDVLALQAEGNVRRIR